MNINRDVVEAMDWAVREYEMAQRDRMRPCAHARMDEPLVLCPAHPDEGAMCDRCRRQHLDGCERMCVRCGGALATEFWHVQTVADWEIYYRADITFKVSVLWLPMCESCADFGEAVVLRKKALLTALAAQLLATPHHASSTQYVVGAHISGQYPELGVHDAEEGVRWHVQDKADPNPVMRCQCCERPGTVGGWNRDGFLNWRNELPLRLSFNPTTEVVYRGLLNIHDLARICDDCAYFWLEAEYPTATVRLDMFAPPDPAA